jgi:flagellar hook protein FlgE
MASTTAIFTGLTGLNANSKNIDVIGNNVANVNTTAYKSSRMLFSTAMSRTINEGSQPGDTTGGTNPFQIGYGVNIAGTQRNFNTGVTSATGDGRDLSIDGGGFFAVTKGQETLYTRAGAFRPNAEQELVTISGERLQGYGVDAGYNVISGSLGAIRVPVGELKIAQATTRATFSGNLNSDGALPTTGARVTLGGSLTSGLRTLSTATPPPPAVVENTSLLTSIEDPQLPGSDTPLFASGQIIELRNAEKGAKIVPTARLTITPTTTLADLSLFLSDGLGLETTVGANPDGLAPGVSLDTATGLFTIVGNTGTVNDLALDSADVRLLSSTGDFIRSPLAAQKLSASTGESVRTSFTAFDSLGSEVAIDVSIVMDGRDSSGTRWRYYASSPDNSDLSTQIATGTLRFDTDGQPINPTPATILVNRAETGAASPLSISLDFASGTNGLTALSDDRSEFSATFRDGSPLGTLASYSIARDGVITGSFTNGLTRTLGQVVLATFNNAEGLVEASGNMFRPGSNSGTAVLTAPGGFGTGELVSGALETSNVDLGEEFTKMIMASTGYSASSRVIRTADELLQQLLVLGR